MKGARHPQRHDGRPFDLSPGETVSATAEIQGLYLS